VIGVCRTASSQLETLGVRIEAGVDLTSEAAIAALVERLAGQPLNGVILNAGLLEGMGLDTLDPASIRRQFEVNALAPLLLARALLPLLAPGSRLALITSRMGSIDDNSSGGSYGYRMSKVALNMAGRSLAVDLRPRGIAVALLHPGLVRTRMVAFNPQGIEPAVAVRGLLARIDALTLETSGSFWHANGEMLPW
jgi:NAD(P)-dependent dehydrogenase (short-subunit alcohol dehydrogenase family)